MEILSIDLIRNYAADLLGFTACAATLLTFAQRRMWPMRVFAIAANIFFIGYGALGLLYPVLLLHLVLLPLNMARLIQLVQQDREPRTTGPKQSGLPLVLNDPQKSTTPPPFSGGQWRASAGSLSTRSLIWSHLGSAPP
jgi:hypothetical protein